MNILVYLGYGLAVALVWMGFLVVLRDSRDGYQDHRGFHFDAESDHGTE
jgi:hypothetical protein